METEWGLKGKPDEIWRNNDRLHIVEIKSTYLPSGRDYPYHSHKMQLASYMRLAEAVYKLPVESGEIRYADGRRYLFNWDFRLKNELRETIEKMRKVDDRGRTYVEVKKSQCQRCYYYSVCDKKRFAR
ncbi:Dna2/Cas4 domain-containing protein [Thermoactinomyces sp. CICC 10735]|nr:Dna2/Cas4 domain-containing protein [Thermoactinomyces sp. CICC 10735]